MSSVSDPHWGPFLGEETEVWYSASSPKLGDGEPEFGISFALHHILKGSQVFNSASLSYTEISSIKPQVSGDPEETFPLDVITLAHVLDNQSLSPVLESCLWDI